MSSTLALRIKAERIAKDLTQIELAKQVSSRSYIVSTWETGKCEPSAEKLALLAKVFGVSIDWLIGRPNALRCSHDPSEVLKGVASELPQVIDALRTEGKIVPDLVSAETSEPLPKSNADHQSYTNTEFVLGHPRLASRLRNRHVRPAVELVAHILKHLDKETEDPASYSSMHHTLSLTEAPFCHWPSTLANAHSREVVRLLNSYGFSVSVLDTNAPCTWEISWKL